MEISGLDRERKFLRSVAVRWELRGWHFTPLDGLDGENAVIDSLWMLGDSPLVWLEFERCEDVNVTSILEDLEAVYRRALTFWDKFRTVFDSDAALRRKRWPYGTYPRRIRQEARTRYWELKTTSRFSVDEVPDIFALQRVNIITEPLTVGHVASLAAMVCVVEAIESLESIESFWARHVQKHFNGKRYQWMKQKDRENLRQILVPLMEPDTKGWFDFVDKKRDAIESAKQAELWLYQANVLDWADSEKELATETAKKQTIVNLKNKEKQRLRSLASLPRDKGKNASVEDVACYFKSRPVQARNATVIECMEHFGVSESTIERRLKIAKEKNLLS